MSRDLSATSLSLGLLTYGNAYACAVFDALISTAALARVVFQLLIVEL